MRHGRIQCSCGQAFYFETVRAKIACIQCNKEYDVSSFPEMKEVDEEDD